MTIRDIQHHLATTIGTELSHETISKVTDQIAEEVLAWQNRPLEALYPVIYLDAIIVKIRDGAHVRNKAAHIAVPPGLARHLYGKRRDGKVVRASKTSNSSILSR